MFKVLLSCDDHNKKSKMAGVCDRKFCNVVMHGICFMLIFTAFQTSGNVQVDRKCLSLYKNKLKIPINTKNKYFLKGKIKSSLFVLKLC